MDSVFLLSPEARARFLHSIARALGCAYICIWSYLAHPSNCLISMDGWYHEDDTGGPSSSSGSIPRRLFDAYRNSFCSVESRCVPGLAYKEGLPYYELGNSDLMNSASMQVQRQFYQEAGIKTAVFMGCNSGEIELGMTTLSNINMQTSIQQFFTEDYLQQSQFGEFSRPDHHSRPSSSSSSLRSLSVGSPEYSSLLLGKASTSFAPDALMEATAEQAIRPTAALIPPHQMTMASNRYRNVQFSIPASDTDEVMRKAMLAVITSMASSSSTSPPPPPLLYHPPQQDPARTSRTVGAFKPYSPALSPKFKSKRNSGSQKMIKMAISTLRKINLMRIEARAQDVRPTTNQLHHMISERKRREKLNESFDALRMLLPTGSKKDKTSVLANTRDYVKNLKAQISELEERNRALEMQLPPDDEHKDVGDSSERIQVQIVRAAESTSEAQQINLRVIAMVECDMIDLVLRVLECLKEMKDITLKSMEATTYSPHVTAFAQATLTILVKASDWDEESFKEAVARAVEAVVARPETATP